MTNVAIAFLLASALVFQGGVYSSTNAKRPLAQPQTTRDRRRLLQQRLMRESGRFESVSRLLREKGVPFNPEVLLNARWRERLASKLS